MLEKPLSIAVGTVSAQKVQYLRHVVDRIGMKANLIPVQVSSGVSEQPLTMAETKRGSIHRAQRALDAIEQASCAIGIEVGYEPDAKSRYSIFAWGTVIDRSNRIISQRSQSLLLPEYFQRVIQKGLQVGDYVHDYERISHGRAVQRYLAELIRHRGPFIKQAAEAVLLQYANQDQY